MKKYLGILIVAFCIFCACSKEDGKVQDEYKEEKLEVKQENNLENQKRIEEESLKQISHLEKIIEQNKNKLVEYELMISTGDTNEIKGLPQFVEDLKLAIKNKEERLKKLKKK